MNTKTLLAGLVLSLLTAGAPLRAAEQPVRFYAKPGSKMRIDGTANMIHTQWRVESSFIGGYVEAGANFPTEPGQAVTPGKIEAKAEPFISIRSLKSVNDDGKPYSDKMDDIMYEKMRATNSTARIMFHLTELTLKEPAKSKDAPYVCEAKGDLAVSGVTNQITFPLNILPLGDKKLKITGTTTVKMSDYKIESPAPKLALGLLKTGDEVKLTWEWIVQERAAAAAAAK